ncbi:MAG: adenosylcobinamide amidohydrolase [Thermodesulfobacteriota bacterium]
MLATTDVLAASSWNEGLGASAPRRIVSLVPAVTEMLYAIGAGDQVAGHTYHSTFPREGVEKVVGGFFAPSLAAIEQKQPDCIILADLHHEVRGYFAGKVPLLSLSAHSIADIEHNILLLGQLTDREAAAERLVARNREVVERIGRKVAQIPTAARQRTIRFMAMGDGQLTTPGDDSFQNDYIRAAGGIAPHFGRNGNMIGISQEEWQRFDPQMVYGCGAKEKIVAALNQPGWREVAAVRNGRIYAFPCDLTCRAGVHAADLVAGLAATLYRDEFSDPRQQVQPDHPLSSRSLDLRLPYVTGARIVTSTIRDFEQKTLVVDLAESMRVLSTLEGMRSGIRAVGNHSFPPPTWGLGHDQGLAALQQQTLAVLGRKAAATSLLFTGADMDNLSVQEASHRELTVHALVTAGVKTNAMRMGEDRGDFYEPGTINIVLLTNMRLSPQAMARAIISATEAKSAVLNELDVRSSYTPVAHQATGTGTDNILVVEGRGRLLDKAGGHTKLGELIARAVAAGVREAIAKQNAITRERPIFSRLAERNISLGTLVPDELPGCKLTKAEAVAALERVLLDPLYDDFLAAALAISDAQQNGLIHDLRAYELWGRAITASLAGREGGQWQQHLTAPNLPPALTMGMDALLNGVCAGAHE